jgi:ornithine carrier protein
MVAVPEEVFDPSPERGSPAVRAAKDIAFGSVRYVCLSRPRTADPRPQVAGIASKFIEHPFDLTKVRLQSQVLDAEARFSGPLDCLKRTYQNEGVRGLYRVRRSPLLHAPTLTPSHTQGLPAPVVGAMAENATLFLAYSELQTVIRTAFHVAPSDELSIPQLALAGAGAGGITSFVLCAPSSLTYAPPNSVIPSFPYCSLSPPSFGIAC